MSKKRVIDSDDWLDLAVQAGLAIVVFAFFVVIAIEVIKAAI